MNVPDIAGEDLEAFAVGRAGCFRMITDGAGRPAHCPKPPAWYGVFHDRGGHPHKVRACEDHRAGLEHARRLEERADQGGRGTGTGELGGGG